MEDQPKVSDERFAIYVRSSSKAEEQAIDVDGQIAAARLYGEARGLRLNFHSIFIDIGSSAASQRPGLEAMLRIAQMEGRPFLHHRR